MCSPHTSVNLDVSCTVAISAQKCHYFNMLAKFPQILLWSIRTQHVPDSECICTYVHTLEYVLATYGMHLTVSMYLMPIQRRLRRLLIKGAGFTLLQ